MEIWNGIFVLSAAVYRTILLLHIHIWVLLIFLHIYITWLTYDDIHMTEKYVAFLFSCVLLHTTQ